MTRGCTAYASAPTWTPACTPSAAESIPSGMGAPNRTACQNQELATGCNPIGFGLGDRDLATHLVRSQMLRAGYPLSQVTEALPTGGPLGATLLPASDDRCETHVVVTDPDTGDQKAIHFQEWVGPLPRPDSARTVSLSSVRRPQAGPGVIGRSPGRRRPSLALQSSGQHRRHPGHRRNPGALRSTPAPVIGYSPIIGGKPCAAWPTVSVGDRVRPVPGSGPALRSAVGDRTAGLLARPRHRRRRRSRRHRRGVPLLMTDPGHRGHGASRTGVGRGPTVTDHGSAARSRFFPSPVCGIPAGRRPGGGHRRGGTLAA